MEDALFEDDSEPKAKPDAEHQPVREIREVLSMLRETDGFATCTS
ncbi:hypothetical protein Vi05172_g5151 [Venturia inaequalis]|nr:hypothetical protein Vi05172_g5151 [Venturia inaequalis]